MNSMKRQKDRTLEDELQGQKVSNMLLGKSVEQLLLKEWRGWAKVEMMLSFEQYCIGSQHVRSINQHKLDVVKQEIARMNTDILGINELKWKGMGEFNSDEHDIYYWGQQSLRRNRLALIVNKRVWNAVLGSNLRNDRMISVHFQGKSFNITVIQVYAPTTNAKEAEVDWFYEDLQELLEPSPKKDIIFIIGDWDAKVGSQEIPGVIGEVWPSSTKWNRAKANSLSTEHTGHSKHPFQTTQKEILHLDIT